MNPAILNNQFVQIALPIILTLSIAAWLNSRGIDAVGKRIDDMGKRIDDLKSDMHRRFDSIDLILREHDQKIVRLEERTSPFARH